MKRIFIFSLLSIALLASCKFRTPKSEREANENKTVEEGEVITVRTASIIFNTMAMDKDMDGKDSIYRSGLSEKYNQIYTQSFGNEYKIIPTKCTDLRLIDDTLGIKLPSIMLGTRNVRMVVFLPGKDPLFFRQLPEPGDLIGQLKDLERSRPLTPDEKLSKETEEIEQRKRDMMKEAEERELKEQKK
jgi:hypothetical protein